MATSGAIPVASGAATYNPLQAQIPGAAQPGATGIPGGATVPGATPVTSGTAVPTPYTPPGTVGVPSNTTSPVNWTTGNNSVVGDYQATYGQGTGTAITQVLSGLGTATDSAIQGIVGETNLEANNQYANIQAQEAASGVTANSSTAALAAGDFYSGVNTGLQSTISQAELGEENTLLQSLESEGSAHGPDTSFLGSLGDVLGSIGGDVSGAVSTISDIPGDVSAIKNAMSQI